MPDLIATRSLRYATRALTAGDPFQASNKDARILVAIKKARPASVEEAAQSEASADAEHQALRDEATKLGIMVGPRWGEKRLKDEIAKASRA
ncbi:MULTISPECIES: hypothetical protein [unclassified Sphingomonas]|uniref:hypothetical protein n=1 Tax=unclassified Sphingomonas TaxID=196159 RepID=UPI001F5AD786|nr:MULTISPECIES: hypothetical protein [unclassified Sphingomonas]